jgi:hypothetical protein
VLKRYSGAGAFSLCLLALPLNAQHAGAGTTLFSFMNISCDARTVALAGASVALPNDGYGIFTNPAALACVNTMQAMIGYRPVGAGVFGAPVGYVLPRNGIGVLGGGIYGLTSGSMRITDKGPDGGVLFTDDFARVDNIAGYAVWARKINEYVNAGVTGKGFYSGIKGFEEEGAVRWSADGLALDFGAQCRFMNSRLIYGFVARNIGFIRSGFTKDDNDYAMPSSVEIGVSYVPRYIENLRVIFDLNKQRNNYLTFTPGAEWEVLPKQLVMRAGYSLNRLSLQAFKNTLSGESDAAYVRSIMTGLCAGVGFNTEIVERKVQFDAAAEFLTVPVLPVLVVSMLMQL